MGKLNWERHQLFGLVDRKPEHQTLVPGAEIAVYPGRDVRTLLMDPVFDLESVGGEVGIEAVVTDPSHGVSNDSLDVECAAGSDLAPDHGEPAGDEDLAGDSGRRAGDQSSIQHRVRMASATLSGWPSVTDSDVKNQLFMEREINPGPWRRRRCDPRASRPPRVC